MVRFKSENILIHAFLDYYYMKQIILVTHDESTFNTYNRRRYVWHEKNKPILLPKGHGKRIMVSDFLLLASRLSASGLSLEQRAGLGIPELAAKRFQFGTNGEGYWWGEEIIQNVNDIALGIFEAIYPGYQALCLFDNATSHSSFAEDTPRIRSMNLEPSAKQFTLRPGIGREIRINDSWW